MKEVQSEASEHLWLLEDAEAFAKHAKKLAEQSARQICILSASLDPSVFDQEDFVDQVSRLARSDRRAQVRILVKDIRPMLDRGHQLLTLSRRLTSKVHIRKLLTDPQDKPHSYLLSDRGLLLYMHEEGAYKGFADYDAAPRVQQLLEDFSHLWEHHSEASPDLRHMHL